MAGIKSILVGYCIREPAPKFVLVGYFSREPGPKFPVQQEQGHQEAAGGGDVKMLIEFTVKKVYSNKKSNYLIVKQLHNCKRKLNDGNNNGQATHGARMAHASTHGARKPPGPILTIVCTKSTKSCLSS